MYYSDKLGIPKTDFSRWRLRTSELGAQRWEYLSTEASQKDPQNECTKYLLNEIFPRPAAPTVPNTASQALDNAATFFSGIQDHKSGTWPNQYKGPMFMSIGYVVASYFTGMEIPEPTRKEMIRYLVNTAHPVDGGWGLHEKDKSTCFGTTMNYVVLRLLGLSDEHPVCVKARKTLMRLGGAIGCPHWGKMWLALLNLYKWEGVNPAPTEMFVLPYAVPIHPMRWWVHTRAIYLAAGYLATSKIKCELTPLLEQLRIEIFSKPFDMINFSSNRNTVCGVDLYYPHSTLLNTLNWFMVKYEKFVRPKWLLDYSNKKAYELLLMEMKNTSYLSIAPVSGAFTAIVLFVEQGALGKDFKRSYDRMSEELFMGPLGMTVMGTNGSQTWDSCFAIQSFFISGLAKKPKYHDMIVRAFEFLVRSQFDTECIPGSFRDKRIGAWPFSTKEQGYTVTDCTSEAMKAILIVMNSNEFVDLHEKFDMKKLYDSIDVVLGLQNVGSFEFGSFASYECIKATPLLELINPAEVFGNIMVEYPYVECTDSSVLGLIYYSKCQKYRHDDIQLAVKRAIEYIMKAQNDDGSWYGSWGICYTYAGMFALEALSQVGQSYENSEVVRKGCDFLTAWQLNDGGWGETMGASETHSYISSRSSLVVQTSWVVIGLLLAEYPDQQVIRRGLDLILRRQQKSGEWLYESDEGVFNHSCAIEYPNYKFIFPIKAIGLYLNRYGDFSILHASS
ncbi:Lanosterol synthase (Oxidosqualene--lanosterol cyclase) [Brettanomyces nanus]|uniref:Terpene cyclase/mutase family member n=1 Tax=Eeniella nana TaxID=13502 RepID=A0A875S725_EENNA|nr:Lanosterol synthase (Oxidosqualene--lanosterol cyclase) [Brettanomyces nanus]QPG77146.1 Lanosterol synthase (Oxidosqualene--lanosterol cyclase) [Brettanomyces nanus]